MGRAHANSVSMHLQYRGLNSLLFHALCKILLLFWHLPLLLVIGSLALPIAIMPINPLPALYYLHSTVYCLHSIAWCKFFDLWKFFEMASYYLSPYWYSTTWCKMVLVLPISLSHTTAIIIRHTCITYYLFLSTTVVLLLLLLLWIQLNCYTTLGEFWTAILLIYDAFGEP